MCDVDPQAVIVIIHTNPKTDKAKGGIPFSDSWPVLEASLPMWGLCRSAPSALRVSFASKWNRAVLALRAYNLKGEP